MVPSFFHSLPHGKKSCLIVLSKRLKNTIHSVFELFYLKQKDQINASIHSSNHCLHIVGLVVGVGILFWLSKYALLWLPERFWPSQPPQATVKCPFVRKKPVDIMPYFLND